MTAPHYWTGRGEHPCDGRCTPVWCASHLTSKQQAELAAIQVLHPKLQALVVPAGTVAPWMAYHDGSSPYVQGETLITVDAPATGWLTSWGAFVTLDACGNCAPVSAARAVHDWSGLGAPPAALWSPLGYVPAPVATVPLPTALEAPAVPHGGRPTDRAVMAYAGVPADAPGVGASYFPADLVGVVPLPGAVWMMAAAAVAVAAMRKAK